MSIGVPKIPVEWSGIVRGIQRGGGVDVDITSTPALEEKCSQKSRNKHSARPNRIDTQSTSNGGVKGLRAQSVVDACESILRAIDGSPKKHCEGGRSSSAHATQGLNLDCVLSRYTLCIICYLNMNPH